MTDLKQLAQNLRSYNAWRRDEDSSLKMPNMKDLGEWIDSAAAPLESLTAERDALAAELERERMRLAACGVVAMSDTPESAKSAREMHEDYRSASCDDVARRVDECMRLRAELAAMREQEPVARIDDMVTK